MVTIAIVWSSLRRFGNGFSGHGQAGMSSSGVGWSPLRGAVILA